ncbi:MAG: serine/threonine protein kinase [Planctomycetota bacterium]|nr:MAG: serine/threonine protein kinase [Planctomycetota bacterium]
MPQPNALHAAAIALFVAWSHVAFLNAAEPWTGWRGPQRDGWVEGYQPPAVWPETLERSWQVDTGTGYGTPLVADGRVYQHGRQDDEEVVSCIDLDSGELIWKQSYATPFKIGGGAEKHGKGPKSSPALADGRVFTLSITGVLSAWDADSGKLLWRRDYDEEFGKSRPYWGAATSPLVDGDRVIVHFGTDEEGALVGLDAATGEEVWRQGNDGASYASPILVEIDGVRQVVDWNHRALVGVDSATGQFLWEYPFAHEGSNQNMPTPVFHEGRVLLGGENRGIHCVEPKRTSDGWTVNHLWHQDDVALDMSSAVINDGLLYGMSHYKAGQYFCLDPDSGEVLWRGPGRLGENVAFLSIPGHVVALVDSGKLDILAADGEKFSKVASYQVSDTPTWAPPVLLEDGVLVKDDHMLTYWSLEQ